MLLARPLHPVCPKPHPRLIKEDWMNSNRLSLVLLMTAVTAVTLGTSRRASAQSWNWSTDWTEVQFRSFDAFMHDHPWIAKKLMEKPQRVNDMGFLNGNRELKQWLEDHPVAARAFHEDPVDFMERERHFEVYGADYSAGPGPRSSLARLDWFLDSHPDVRHDLMHKPRLVDDGRYLDRHPELSEFLYRHPDVRRDLDEHPREFMDREARYEHGD